MAAVVAMAVMDEHGIVGELACEGTAIVTSGESAVEQSVR
jgi:hypothetical protein